MKRPRQKRCCKCGSCLVETQYHGQWYCNSCFRKKQLCCICGENPVEVTKGDNGYCKKMLREQREYRLYPVCGCTCILRQSDPAVVFLLDQDQIASNSISHFCNDRFNCRYGGNRFFAKEIRPEIWSIDVKILKLISLEQKSFFSKVKQ